MQLNPIRPANRETKYFTLATTTSIISNVFLPLLLAALLTRSAPTSQHFLLIKSFSLLLLGLFLSTLATLNFSLSFMIGLLCAPLTFINRICPKSTTPSLRYSLSTVGLLFLNILSPPVVLLAACWYKDVAVETVLTQAAFGWDVWGMWTQVVVWCVWWPAWLIGGTLLGSSMFG